MKKKQVLLIGMFAGLLLVSCNRNAQTQSKKETSEETLVKKKDTLLSVQGKLIIGHEVRSFTADGDTAAYWITDKSNRLDSLYKQRAGTKPYAEVHVELKVKDLGKATEGFPADYTGVYEVVDILGEEK